MAAKGGAVRDITPGDCLELLKHCRKVFAGNGPANRRLTSLSARSYPRPPSSPWRAALSPGSSPRFPRPLTPGQLVDRYDLACRARP